MIKITDIKKHKEDIIALWQEAFGDEREYIEFFLEECPDIVCVGSFVEDRLASMLFLLNGNIGKYRCKYLYAACTLKCFRGRGLMGELIEYTKAFCFDEGYDFIFLVPGEESLYSYYSKFGFEAKFQKAVYTVSADEGNGNFAKIEDVDLAAQKRIELLSEVDGFCFDEKTTRYVVRELLNGGGEICYSKEEFLFFARKDEKNYVIKEFLPQKGFDLTVNLHLFKNLGKENIYIHTPIVYNSRNNGCVCTKCGMLYPLREEAKAFLQAHGTLYAGMYLD